jgi:hypothetical protein
MRGIVFAVALAVSLFAPPRVVEAQSATKVFRVVELNPIPSAGQGAPQKVFRQTLRDLGYVQGKSILVEDRFAAGSEARLREDAAEAFTTRKVKDVCGPRRAIGPAGVPRMPTPPSSSWPRPATPT